MKRFLFAILVLGLCLGLAGPANAGIVVKALNDADGTALSAYALTSGSAVYSEAIRVSDSVIYASLLAIESKAGGLGDVDISIEYSVDKVNWYSAYTTTAGAVTVDANIYTELQSFSCWVQYTPRLGPYMRYKFDPDADSAITTTHIHQETR